MTHKRIASQAMVISFPTFSFQKLINSVGECRCYFDKTVFRKIYFRNILSLRQSVHCPFGKMSFGKMSGHVGALKVEFPYFILCKSLTFTMCLVLFALV